MSRFDAQFAASGVPALMDQHRRDDVTVTPAGGSAVALKAMVGDEQRRVEPNLAGEDELIRRRVVTISSDPASTYGGIASLGVRAKATIDGEDWNVTDVLSRNASLTRFEVTIKATMQRGTLNDER